MVILTNWYWFKIIGTYQLAASRQLKQYPSTLVEYDYNHQGQASELVTKKTKTLLYIYFRMSERKFMLVFPEAESVQDREIEWTDCFICQNLKWKTCFTV